QRVDYGQGKPAVTRYRVLERRDGHTLIALQPLTGRTHQLRVHCSHPQGLNCPIVGDRLYGRASSRLMLHARSVTFDHPATGRSLSITCPVPFL
ncbi:MAG: RNA pseudouridine synthase, partial [Muribaculaceae bacterium]|nr:RNA pseudouridine synthase [Muribaculaceae bacterium]